MFRPRLTSEFSYVKTSRLRQALSFFSMLGIFLIAPLSPALSQTILEDDFDDNTAGWTLESLTGNFGFEGDSDAVFGFDYSALGIPEAPNSDAGDAATRGVRIRTNNGGLGTDQAAIYIEDAAIAGTYTVEVDMWLNWSADQNNIGTTENGGLYVGNAAAGDPTILTNSPVQRGAGVFFSTDNECVNCSYVLTKNQHELDTFSGQYTVTDFGFGNQPGFDNEDVNTNPANGDLLNIPAIFPEFNIATATGNAQGTPTDLVQPAGAVGFQWVTVTAVVDPTDPGIGTGPGVGTATFSVENAATGESFVIGTVDNSVPDVFDDDGDGDDCDSADGSEDICANGTTGDRPVDLEGRVSLFMIDFFGGAPSSLDLGFGLFDNIRVFATDSGGGLDGDFNEDGVVDAADYTTWRAGLGTTFTEADYLLWRSNYGAVAGSASSTSTVPEPSMALLTLLASAGISLTRRRR